MILVTNPRTGERQWFKNDPSFAYWITSPEQHTTAATLTVRRYRSRIFGAFVRFRIDHCGGEVAASRSIARAASPLERSGPAGTDTLSSVPPELPPAVAPAAPLSGKGA